MATGRCSRCKECMGLAIRARAAKRKVMKEINQEKFEKKLAERRVILKKKDQ
jgi:hypothetical protein